MAFFPKQTYIERRRQIKEKVGSGLLLFFGNNEAPCNYPANGYNFRQDSTFLYFFGIQRDGLVGVIDIDEDKEYLFGDDIDIEDIIWTGFVPSVKELAEEVGITNTASMRGLHDLIRKKVGNIHYLPPYRHDIMIQIEDLLGIPALKTRRRSLKAMLLKISPTQN